MAILPMYRASLKAIADTCRGCDICSNECSLLKENGTPGAIAERFLAPDTTETNLAYYCNLCGLCDSVCPMGLEPSRMFLAMRQNHYARSGRCFPQHSGILNYERIGSSKPFSLYRIPAGCDTVFFPGCTLTGTRRRVTEDAYAFIKTEIPQAGIVLDCCTKPSHDLGRTEVFSKKFREMIDFLRASGITAIITACPNCYSVFERYADGMTVTTLYEMMAGASTAPEYATDLPDCVTIHDPCVTRFKSSIHDAVRTLVARAGMHMAEMKHSRSRTICCGEGGSVSALSPETSFRWADLRKREVNGFEVITYCAGCASTLGKTLPVRHLLDLCFPGPASRSAKPRIAAPPFTYLNRLIIRQKLKIAAKTALMRRR